MTGGEPLQRVADGDICIAQEANVAPFANRADETIHCQAGSRAESSEQQVQLAGRVTLEQLVSLECMRHRKDEDEHHAGAEIGRLLPRECLEFVAEALRGLTHDRIRKVRVGAEGAGDHLPGLGGQQKQESTGNRYHCRATDCLDIHVTSLFVAR